MIVAFALVALGMGLLALSYRIRWQSAEESFGQVVDTAQALLKRELELRRLLLRAARWLEDATNVIEAEECCMEEDGEVEDARSMIEAFRAEARR